MNKSPRFPTTSWTRVAYADDPTHPHARAAIAELFQLYWYPAYAVIRRYGTSPQEAEDLTQSFFLYAYEHTTLQKADRTKGRFRTFVTACLRNFFSDDYRHRTSAKQGGSEKLVSFNALAAEARYAAEPVDNRTPEKLFEGKLALEILAGAMKELEDEAADPKIFAAIRGYINREDDVESYAAIASRLKASNVFIVEDQGQGERAVILDFGVARDLTAVSSGSSGTGTGEVPGTLGHIAPKLKAGKKPTVVSDVYSLGVVFCHMLTGKIPDGNPHLARAFGFDYRLDAVAGIALSQEPDARYLSAADLAKAIKDAIGQASAGRSADLGSALAAVFLPGIGFGIFLFLIATALSGVPLIGAIAGAGGLILVLAHVGPLLLGAIIGGLIA